MDIRRAAMSFGFAVVMMLGSVGHAAKKSPQDPRAPSDERLVVFEGFLRSG
jgi:hypothetical protein